MYRETILKEYEATIQARFELAELLSSSDLSNAEFRQSNYDLLCLLETNLSQTLKIIEKIAENESNLTEIYEIQRKHFGKLALTSKG